MPDKEVRSKSSSIRTHVVQVSNVSPSATREQLHHMFSYLGRIQELKIFPSETNPLSATSLTRLCYVRFEDTEAAETAQHLTNTALIDRAIICIPVAEDRIPDEQIALQIGGPALPGQRVLPSHLVNQIQMIEGQQAMVTVDPTLTTAGLPNYPPLPSNTDATKLEEIRRTVYIGNIPKDASTDELLEFFNDKIGEVMYMRFAGADDLPSRYLYVEFTNQVSVPKALMANGIEFKGSSLSIQHSTVTIVKPRAKTQDMAKKEVEEAARKAEAAGSLGKYGDTDEAVRRYSARNSLENAAIRAAASITRSRSRSRDRRGWGSRSRSRSRSRRDRRRISRSPSRDRYPRSARRSRSPSPRRRSRDRDRGSRRRSPSRERDRRRRPSRSPVDSRRRRSRDRDRSKDRDRNRDKDREKDKDKRDKDRKEQEKNREKDTKKKTNGKEESSQKATPVSQREDSDDNITAEPATVKVEPKPEPIAVSSLKSSEPMELESDRLVEDLLEEAEMEKKREKEAGKQEKPSSSPTSMGGAKREAISDEDDSGNEREADSIPMGEIPQPHTSKSAGGRKKEKRKKEKKEKKKKRERSNKKKKSAKGRNDSSSDDDDDASTIPSD